MQREADFTVARLPSVSRIGPCWLIRYMMPARPTDHPSLSQGLRAMLRPSSWMEMAVGATSGGVQRLFRGITPRENDVARRSSRPVPISAIEYLYDSLPSRPRIEAGRTSRVRPHKLFPATVQKKPGPLKAKACGFALSGPCASDAKAVKAMNVLEAETLKSTLTHLTKFALNYGWAA